jgi:hypothetical protein
MWGWTNRTEGKTMPRFKPRPDIPPPILRALCNDRYDQDTREHFEDLPEHIRGKFSHTISVTTMARAPRQRILYARHEHEIEIDPEDRKHALFGRIVHTILEQYKEPWQIVEDRQGILFPIVVNGERITYYLHGCADLYDPRTGHLDDYKTPKVGSLRYDKSDFDAQLNVLGYIWRKNNRKVTKLGNDYLLLKDYDPRMVREGSDYPATSFPTFEVPIWSDEDCMAHITKRLTVHYTNDQIKNDEGLDYCTPEERWQSAPMFKVYKLEPNGEPQKTAKHTAGSRTEAEDVIEQLQAEELGKLKAKNNELKKPKPESTLVAPSYRVVEFPSEPRKCPICDCRHFCNQYLSEMVAAQNAQAE